MNKYNNKYHKIIFKKPVDLNPTMHVDFNKENYKEGPKFRVGDNIRTSKYRNIFAKGYVPNWPDEVFVVTKVKNTVPWTYVISDLYGELWKIYKKEQELQKTNKKELKKK